MFKFSLESFDALPIFVDLVHVSRKRLVVERNGPNFGPQGYVFDVYIVRLTVNCSSSVWGYFAYFRISASVHVVSRKRLIVERNGSKFGPHGSVISVNRVLLTIKCSCSAWGHSVHV